MCLVVFILFILSNEVAWSSWPAEQRPGIGRDEIEFITPCAEFLCEESEVMSSRVLAGARDAVNALVVPGFLTKIKRSLAVFDIATS